MNVHRPNLPLALALLGSLLIHALGLAAAKRVSERRHTSITGLSAANPVEEEHESRDPDEAVETEINPGIDDGALSTVTWIGYEEYEEHLAQLAEIDQAAFTRTETRGASTSTSVSPMTPEVRAAINQLMEPMPRHFALPEPPIVADLEESGTPVIDGADSIEEKTDEIVTETPDADQITAQPTEDPATKTEPPTPAETDTTDPAEAEGEPTAPDAEESEKDSEATSTREVPRIDWNSGKPVAIEGLEIRPYSLYRHIVVDSKDIHFAMMWTNSIARNPIVELSFDRTGRVAKLNVLRESGHAALDRQYLRSWLSRWTATGEKLTDLMADQVTQPIMIRLIFIDEPQEKDKKGDG